MKFYITHEKWFYKDLWTEQSRALWVREREDAKVFDDYSTAFRTACEVQSVTETAVNVACVG